MLRLAFEFIAMNLAAAFISVPGSILGLPILEALLRRRSWAGITTPRPTSQCPVAHRGQRKSTNRENEAG